MIIDNALTNLTVNHSDLLGPMVGLAIIDNLTTPTATTLTLSLGADGVNAVRPTSLVPARHGRPRGDQSSSEFRSFFSVRPHIDPVASRTALGALHLGSEPRNERVPRIALIRR